MPVPYHLSEFRNYFQFNFFFHILYLFILGSVKFNVVNVIPGNNFEIRSCGREPEIPSILCRLPGTTDNTCNGRMPQSRQRFPKYKPSFLLRSVPEE